MSILICKNESVKLRAITPALGWMFYATELFVRNCDYTPPQVVITSINDGVHGEKSRHYSNEAFDIRSLNFALPTKEKFRRELESYLNANSIVATKGDGFLFRVLFEIRIVDPKTNLVKREEHFHLQVAKGKHYP